MLTIQYLLQEPWEEIRVQTSDLKAHGLYHVRAL